LGGYVNLNALDDNRKNIHRWLSAPDPWLNYNKALKERQAGTGTWFIKSKQYANWKTNPDSILWLHGIPGCGKTILSSTIIEDVLDHCHQDPTRAVIYFYFDFNDVEKQQHEKMMCSLITQLSLRCTSTPRVLAALFSSCMNGERQPTSDTLLTTLQQMIQEFDEIFVILDALDECKERQELLEDINKIARWKIGKSHILATSRREKDIEESLDSLVNDQKKICIQSALVNDDIRTYVQKRLQSDQNLKRWRNKPEVQQEIETKLMGKADGM
jgi:adenylylsulfate kinase-like enzyme